ncbi:hypothetical protein B7486_05000 [cyanobacterium TDX16]|nr:hypothetical protein B7486_05000 [cyanobacterium TDX16]
MGKEARVRRRGLPVAAIPRALSSRERPALARFCPGFCGRPYDRRRTKLFEPSARHIMQDCEMKMIAKVCKSGGWGRKMEVTHQNPCVARASILRTGGRGSSKCRDVGIGDGEWDDAQRAVGASRRPTCGLMKKRRPAREQLCLRRAPGKGDIDCDGGIASARGRVRGAMTKRDRQEENSPGGRRASNRAIDGPALRRFL